MRPLKLKPQLTSAEFKTALRNAGFGVERGLIVDLTETCRGFTAVATFRNNGSVDRNATLSKVIRERDAEIARRAAAAKRSAGLLSDDS